MLFRFQVGQLTPTAALQLPKYTEQMHLTAEMAEIEVPVIMSEGIQMQSVKGWTPLHTGLREGDKLSSYSGCSN